MKHPYSSIPQRHRLQWLYASATVIVLALGWKIPALGFLVPVAMIGGMVSGPVAGRWFCGNLCPRGGFLERIIARYSKGKAPPKLLASTPFRVGVMLFLFTMIGLNVKDDPLSWRQWGYAFWLICVVTTAVGAALAYFWHARSWCAICPMGTMQNWMGGNTYHLKIDPKKCRSCLRCEKSCPMKLKIIAPAQHEEPSRTIPSRDCIRCGECVASCPVKTLHFEKNQ